MSGRLLFTRLLVLASVVVAVGSSRLPASDHADPIDPLNRKRLEGGITDLFVFPVFKDQTPAHRYTGNADRPLSGSMEQLARVPLSEDEQAEIDSLVVVLCVRRALTDSGTLILEPFTYRVHIDTNPVVQFAQADSAQSSGSMTAAEPGYGSAASHGHDAASGRPTPFEAFLRYGGQIEHPEKISEEVILEYELTNKALFKPGYPKFVNLKGTPLKGWDRTVIPSASGVFDDPFIFPAFFKTNIVAMVLKIPMSVFESDDHGTRPKDFLIWATSHRGSKQIDHVGRSLRTQNPRFELLNTLHPSQHVRAILDEHENPGLLRDVALRLNFAQEFAYRRWDFVPDVMIYTTRYPVGFPNGRLLDDDVASALAQWGDTLLFELSYQHNNGSWPRQTKNDAGGGQFLTTFPYLLPPQPEREQAPPLRLSNASLWKIAGILFGLLLLFLLENWLVAVWYCRRRRKKSLLQ